MQEVSLTSWKSYCLADCGERGEGGNGWTKHGHRKKFVGYWRIVEMEVWDKDYLDLVVPAFIEFDREQMGQFQFGTVRGWLDCRFDERQGAQIVDFSWEGENDNDPGCGRGWAALREDRLEGRLYIHRGDDSAFTASRAERAAPLRRRGPLSVARRPTSASRRRPPGGRA